MPRYTYVCKTCGSFDEFRTMTEFEKPARCPACNEWALRAVAAPQLNRRTTSNRKAHQLNERSANEPRVIGSEERRRHEHNHSHSHEHAHKHQQKGAAGRPWMVGH